MSETNQEQEEDASYIDYETFLAPDFKPATFANNLVLATNNPNDLPLDLSTPLSKVLFDAQEIDSHIDLLTTRSAIPLLTHTKTQTDASGRIIAEIDGQVQSLNDSYKQLEREVIEKHAEADQVRQVATRLWETLKLGRSAGRCLQLGRQLEVQHAELSSSGTGAAAAATTKSQDHRALVRCANTIVSLREILERREPGEEGHGLERVNAVRSLQEHIVAPIERSVRAAAEQTVREFWIAPSSSSSSGSSNATTYAQGEETKARTVSAMTALYLISPTAGHRGKAADKWTPLILMQALEVYLRNALQSSTASLARSLAQLPSLDRTLAEVAARCQSIMALEAVLESTRVPVHPLLVVSGSSGGKTTTTTTTTTTTMTHNLLQPLLSYLETGSLASYFWRTMAGSLAPRVQEIVNRGGVSARTLKTNRNSVGDAVRECVIRGSQPPSSAAVPGVAAAAKAGGKGAQDGGGGSTGWDREVAVMVGSVVGNLGR